MDEYTDEEHEQNMKDPDYAAAANALENLLRYARDVKS